VATAVLRFAMVGKVSAVWLLLTRAPDGSRVFEMLVRMRVIFLHERPGPLQVAGLMVAIAGVWLANRPARASS
jgi:drug/metabolite transporter (DMT)-like permease